LVQLASLLQQANLVVPASPSPQAISNHVAATPLISDVVFLYNQK